MSRYGRKGERTRLTAKNGIGEGPRVGGGRKGARKEGRKGGRERGRGRRRDVRTVGVDAPEQDELFLKVLPGFGLEEDLGLDGGLIDAREGEGARKGGRE